MGGDAGTLRVCGSRGYVLRSDPSYRTLSAESIGTLRHEPPRGRLALMLPAFAFLSLFWVFWDPTWQSVRDSRLQGRTLRVVGRERYIVCRSWSSFFCDPAPHHQPCQRCQMIIWLSRLATSGLIAAWWLELLTDSTVRDHSQMWCATALAIEVVVRAILPRR